MTFLAPWQLLWLGLLAPLIVLYILKRRRAERLVGSTLLWERALRDMRAERPWKRLIPHLSLILQALAIIAGSLALARPTGATTLPSGARIAVVVDTSASMAATDGEGVSRIERARTAASGLARTLPPGSRLLVIEAGTEPVVLTPATDDPVELSRAVAALEVRGGSADLEAAVALAVERLRGGPDGSKVIVLTDGSADGSLALDSTFPVEVRHVGAAADNTGIVAVDVRERPVEGAPDRADVFVRVGRVAARPAEIHVTASIAGGRTVASRRLTLEARGTESIVLTGDLPPDAAGRAAVVQISIAPADPQGVTPPQAELRPRTESPGMGDALALDDVAVAPSPAAGRLPVFLVGRAPPSVERVLRADDDVELFATSLASLAEREDDAPPLDGLIVYTGELPETPPAGDSVVVAPAGDRVFEVELGAEVEHPRVVTWDEEDPRLRFVSLADLHLASVRPVQGAAARPLVTTDRGAALASVERPDGETTIVAFDPAASDWPRQPSFVIFFRNLLERARSRRAAGGVAPGRLGEPLRIPAPDGESVTVTTPGGDRHEARSRGGLAVVPVPAEPGVYRVEVAGRELHALRNLLDRGETDLSRRLELTRGGASAAGEAREPDAHVEAWPYVAAALLLFLVVEAWWATRRPRRTA